MLSIQVNGFEVHDTEEAILCFLEQDPEIVLSVARLKVILLKVICCDRYCYYKPGGCFTNTSWLLIV